MPEYKAANIRLWAKLGQRAVFGNIVAPELAASDERVLFLAADVAASAGLGRLQDSMPDRLLNMGIAEQNMIGVASGLAMEGFIPFACSFAPFISARVADQVRLCLGYMRLPVKLVALASGLAMAINGPSHLGFEDVAIMRAIPGINIVCPADATEAVKACLAVAQSDQPAYLRLTGAANAPVIYANDYDFQIGKAVVLKEGADIALIANGPMVQASMKAAEILAEHGVSAGVLNMHTIAPLDTEAIDKNCGARLLVVVEEHGLVGGLGSAVAEYLAGLSRRPPLLAIGLAGFPHAAPYAAALSRSGLAPEAMASRVMATLDSLTRSRLNQLSL